MDNRWRFLYCDATELRGHAREAPPGKEPRGKRNVQLPGKTGSGRTRRETTEIK